MVSPFSVSFWGIICHTCMALQRKSFQSAKQDKAFMSLCTSPNSLTYVVKYVQIMLLFVLPNSLEGANYAKNLLRAAILVQYFPKLFRFLPLLIGQSPTGFIFESAWANFIINLLIFMLASHVVGSCWYLFGLQVKDITLNLFFFSLNIEFCPQYIIKSIKFSPFVGE